MRKVVFNACYGGFSLSEKAVKLGRELSGDDRWGEALFPGETYSDGTICDRFYGYIDDIERHDLVLVKVVETLGEEAGGCFSNLRIAEVDGKYRIDEYDGFESVETPDSYDWIE